MSSQQFVRQCPVCDKTFVTNYAKKITCGFFMCRRKWKYRHVYKPRENPFVLCHWCVSYFPQNETECPICKTPYDKVASQKAARCLKMTYTGIVKKNAISVGKDPKEALRGVKLARKGYWPKPPEQTFENYLIDIKEPLT